MDDGVLVVVVHSLAAQVSLMVHDSILSRVLLLLKQLTRLAEALHDRVLALRPWLHELIHLVLVELLL